MDIHNIVTPVNRVINFVGGIFHGFTSQRIHPENSVFQKGTL